MKKLSTLWIALAALLLPMNLWAVPDLANDYTLVRSVTFGDGADFAGTEACTYTAWDTGNQKQQTLTVLTAPEDAAGWIALQAWANGGSGKGWWNRADKGLYCFTAQRSGAVFGDDLTVGWLVVFKCTASGAMTVTRVNGDNEPDGPFTYELVGNTYYCTITAESNAYVGFCGVKNTGFITSISVYKPNNAVVMTTYTLKFVDMDGNELKSPVTHDAVAGNSISITDADKANITVGDNTYIYDSDDSDGVTVAEDGSTVVTLKFHQAQNFSYKVNEVCDGAIVRTTEGVSYETARVQVPYRRHNVLDGQLYTKGASSKEYNYYFNLTEDNMEINLTDYSAAEGVDNVIFLSEGEDIEGLNPCNSANTGIRSSNSASAYAPADVTITTLEPGKYKFVAYIYDASKSPNSHWIFKAGAIQVADLNCTTVNIQELASEEFAVGKDTPFIMAKGGGNTMGLDLIYIMKTGDVTDEEAAELNAAAEKAEKAARVFSIVGDLSGGWENDLQMTQSQNEGEEDIYTLVIEGFEAKEVKAYEYKLRDNNDWEGFQLPDNGNKSWTPEKSGIYTITITADVANYTLDAVAERTDDCTWSMDFVNCAGWENVYAYTFNPETAGAWPGTQIEKSGTKTIDEVEYDVYTYSLKAEAAPANIIFHNGDGIQTADLAFVDGGEFVSEISTVKTFTVTYVNVEDWEAVYAYVWTGDTPIATWPGELMVKTEDQVDGHDVYSYSISAEAAPANIIFNNGQSGDGNQTEDLVFEDGKQYTDGAKGQATGINAVSATNGKAVIYNLQGQRVDNVSKGIYIINGKKVLR